MSKTVKAIASSCSTHDLDRGTITEEPDFGVGKSLSGMVDMFLAVPPFNEQRYREDDHVEYDVLGLSDMKDKEKV